MEDSGGSILWIILAAASVLIPLISKKLNKNEGQHDTQQPMDVSVDDLDQSEDYDDDQEQILHTSRQTTSFTDIADNSLVETLSVEKPDTDDITAQIKNEGEQSIDLDFDAKKAIIFSEILKPKFDE